MARYDLPNDPRRDRYVVTAPMISIGYAQGDGIDGAMVRGNLHRGAWLPVTVPHKHVMWLLERGFIAKVGR